MPENNHNWLILIVDMENFANKVVRWARGELGDETQEFLLWLGHQLPYVSLVISWSSWLPKSLPGLILHHSMGVWFRSTDIWLPLDFKGTSLTIILSLLRFLAILWNFFWTFLLVRRPANTMSGVSQYLFSLLMGSSWQDPLLGTNERASYLHSHTH